MGRGGHAILVGKVICCHRNCLESIALSESFNQLSDSLRIRNSTDPATLKSDVDRIRDGSYTCALRYSASATSSSTGVGPRVGVPRGAMTLMWELKGVLTALC